jgi:hypothetical protein
MLALKDSAEFDRQYAEPLAVLGPRTVAEELRPDAILLCWEPLGKPCHRHDVARWLEAAALGIEIPEFVPPAPPGAAAKAALTQAREALWYDP